VGRTGRSTGAVDVLWLVLVLLVLLFVQIRNWFGFCSVLVTGTVLLAASWWLPDRGQSVLAYLVTWFLLMAAPRPVLELAAQRRRRGVRGTPDSDADQLARLTGVPAAVWIALQGVGPVDQEGGENFNGPGGALLGQAVHRQPEVMLVPLGGCSMSRLRQVQLTSGRSNWICQFAKW
jgi:Peptidase M50B-like